MASASVATVAKMLESLPPGDQDRVVERLGEYIQELQDDFEWDASFKKTERQLIAAAQRARQEMVEGKAEPLDL